jgi:hypothetical protein
MRICTMPACGSTKGVEKNRLLGRDVCARCYSNDLAPKENCVLCGHIRNVSFREADGGAVCITCAKRPPKKHCSTCGEFKAVAARTEDGRPMCPRCYGNLPKRQAQCVTCRRKRQIRGRTKEGASLCGTCISKDPKYLIPCVICGGQSIGVQQTHKGIVGKCCYRKLVENQKKCGWCGRMKVVYSRDKKGKPLCSTCIKKDPSRWKECILCLRRSPPAKVTPKGPIGKCCYWKLPERHAHCASCRRFRIICGRTDDSAPLCGGCARRARTKKKRESQSTFVCAPA